MSDDLSGVDDTSTAERFAFAIIPRRRHCLLRTENLKLNDASTLDFEINTADFPILCTLPNLSGTILVSDECVERAFAKHKLIHNYLRARLSTKRLDDELFIRYTFEHLFKKHKEIFNLDEIPDEYSGRNVTIDSEDEN